MHCFCTNAHIYSCEHVFIQTFIIRACPRSFVCTLMCSCTCSVFFVRSLLHSSDGLLVCSLLFRAFVGPLVCSLFHSLVRSRARSFLCAFVRSLVHSCNHSFSVYSFVGALVCTLFYFSCRCSVARLLGGQRPLLVFFFFNVIWMIQPFVTGTMFFTLLLQLCQESKPYIWTIQKVSKSDRLFLFSFVENPGKNTKQKEKLAMHSIVKLWSVTVLVFCLFVFFYILLFLHHFFLWLVPKTLSHS